MDEQLKETAYYPTQEELQQWAEGLFAEAETIKFEATDMSMRAFTHSMGCYNLRSVTYVKFTTDRGSTFYCYWQRAMSTPAPLLIHTPGYNSEVSMHPHLLQEGYNILHVNPLGYATPWGPDLSKKKDGSWPVLRDFVQSYGKEGYREWLVNTILAVKWALSQPECLPDRVSFFGTSQGGAGSLVLGSVFKDHGVRCVAADLPYLVNLPLCKKIGCYNTGADNMEDPEKAWKAVMHMDAYAHRERLSAMPVLLTAGGADTLCRQETIRSLFDALTGMKSFMLIKDEPHRYTQPFLYMAAAWFRMFA